MVGEDHLPADSKEEPAVLSCCRYHVDLENSHVLLVHHVLAA